MGNEEKLALGHTLAEIDNVMPMVAVFLMMATSYRDLKKVFSLTNGLI